MKKIILTVIFTFAIINLVIAITDEDIFYEKCTSCHGQEIVFKKNYSAKQWKKVIKKMKKYGLKINYSEQKAVISFLKNRKSINNEQ